MLTTGLEAQLRTGIDNQVGTGLQMDLLPRFDHQGLADKGLAVALHVQVIISPKPNLAVAGDAAVFLASQGGGTQAVDGFPTFAHHLQPTVVEDHFQRVVGEWRRVEREQQDA